MGPPGAGKSSVWKTLAKAQDKAGKKTLAVDVNPKVVSTRDLYGYVTPAKEWKDGLLSKTMRTLGEYQDTNPKWILLDGDLDANWIESMNSVMDDNKILTLASNERIPLKPHMRMIFEIRDLKFATPATVSRAGILYISDEGGAQWKSYVKSWIANNLQDEQLKVNLQKLFDRFVEPSLAFIRRNCKFLLTVSQMAMVISLCKSLQPLLAEKYSNLEYTFAYAAVWALGGALAEKDGHNYRKDFSSFFKNEFKSVKWPTKGTVFDYFVENLENGVKLEEWEKIVQPIDYETSVPMQSITVPTPESVSLTEFMNNFILVGHPVLLIGMAGGGKTQLCKGVLKEINNVVKKKKLPDQFVYTTINFNYYTDSTYLQNMLEQPLEKKAGKQFGPQGKNRLIYFIDDLNMPQLDPYNTQTAIALLRQHADYLHWYDVGKLTLKEIINTQTIAAMNPTAGSFSVNARYQRHFWTCSVPFPDNNSLFIIFSTFLNGHFKKFKQNVQEQSKPIITATLQLHAQVSSLFKKTAFEFHYEFNIRHIAGIFQGLLMAAPTLPAQYGQAPQSFGEDKIVMLWVHESERVYGDRLVKVEHLDKFKNALSDIAKKNFPKVPLNKHLGSANAESLIFCNFPLGITNDRYLDKIDLKTLEERVNEALKDYNDNYAVMDLVLFEDAMRHVTKITRIISQPSGHALLVGVGGSGKQSLARLASHICTYSTFQITISQTYGMNELKQDLSSLYTKTGMKDEGILFLFTDGQITNERFLVYINDLLSSGEVADLYAPEDKDNIINQIRAKVKSAGIQDTRENCWNYYIDRVKANLHMALCFSPVGEGLRRRARQFPALVNSTVIDWFQPWPKQALRNVAASFLKEVDFIPEAIRENVIDFMPYSFERVNKASEEMLLKERRYVYTTPKSFLELIKLFKTMLNRKKDELESSKGRYQLGLEKLQETASSVSQLEKELQVMQVEVEAKKSEADKVAEVVGKEKEKVMKETDKANVEADKASQIKAEVEAQKASTEKDLNDALPLKDKAKAALQDISVKDFQFLKGLTNPPSDVGSVCNTTIYLLAGVNLNTNVQVDVDGKKKPKSVDWKQYLKLLKNPANFKEVLMEIPRLIEENQIPAQNINPIRAYLNEPFFKPEIMESKSGAAKGICSYIINIVQYFDVISIILPKQKALAEAAELLSAATTKVEHLNAIVAELQAQLAEKEAEYNKAMGEKNAAEAEANRCQMRLGLAQRLVNALGSENDRWAKSIEDISKSLEVLVGDVILGSSFVSYAGPFIKKYREAVVKDFLKWLKERKIPMSPNSDPLLLLTNEALKAEWNQQGLPPDVVSIENGTILVNSERYSLIIDPQLQGISWIREKEKKNNLQVTRLGNKTLVNTLEMSIENGYSVLLENLDEQIDATLNPIIARNTFKRGKNRILKFGGKDLVLHENFRLFMHTKLANPHYPPEIQAEATLINFTVTEDGLGDQLLNLVVGKERPDLASKKIKLIKQQNEFKITLKRLEEELLFKLTNAQGDILSDIALIENLETSKKISIEIAEKVIIAKATEKIINEASEAYRTVATRGALIFFLMNDLYKIHTFYMYSLESFVIVVNRAIDSLADGKSKKEAPKKEEPAQQEAKVEEVKEEGAEEKKAEGEGGEGEGEGEGAKEKEEAGAEDDKKSQKSGGDAKSQKDEENEKAADDDDGEISNAPIDKKRVEKINERITEYAFHYVRRGLFEKHKLIVATMLCLRILERHKDDKVRLPSEEINHLITGKIDPIPPAIPESVKGWVTESIWQAISALESLPYFKDIFLKSLCEQDSLQWRKWYSEEKAELADLPKSFKELEGFPKLLLLRAMRPDRMASALSFFVKDKMGAFFTEQPPFSIDEVYGETTSSIPIFFVLFPGVDPTPDVEKVGLKCGISKDNNKFENISMGQGQDKRATDALFKAAKDGTWIMLQNVHLMQGWLKSFERSLETASQSAHPNFRCFISSEPPPLPDMKIIPESLLQNCIKVSNEAPQDLKANLRRAYAKFDQETIGRSTKPNEFKAILFALCMFHSLVLGRKKFGSQGWSRVYNFNDGDLTICADVLHNYLEKYEQVPYADLRYIYGEIMYGGHITDNWDRRTNATYLEKLIRPELLNKEFRLVQGLVNPEPHKHDYEAYRRYIEEKLPLESPMIFGMHSNAEIGFLSEQCVTIFNTITDVQGGSTGSSGAKSGDGDILDKISKYRERLPKSYIIFDIEAKIKEKFKEKGPYIVVALQECTRMNGLLAEIERSLEELRRGLTGELNMTDTMEGLSLALNLNRVPPDWGKYPSKKGLASWFNDLIERTNQLHEWTSEMIIPKSLWISGLFNPMSFLTAIMQVTARAKGLPLDEMVLQTNVTGYKTPEEVPGYAENGFYVHGLYLEGAGWELGGGGADGYLTEAKLKDLHPKLPVVNVVSVLKKDRKITGQYQCPTYVTSLRGPTYVFTANLQMESDETDARDWILGGVALLMADD